MVTITDKSQCCGCWACENICPKHCIRMEEDSEGFRYPVVDTDKCIDCGLCEKVCPIKQPRQDDTAPESFVVQNKNVQILRTSTSGGFYSAIANYVIERKGVVFGASFNGDMTLRHTYSETLEGCAQFRGSKYVQSLIGNSYSQAKRFLDDGRWVVFSGTPCQIAGLFGFLRNRKYEKLITVDLVCHGTPSPRLLAKYLAYHSSIAGSKVIDYRSRDKYYGYDYSTATITFADKHKSYHKGMEGDMMLRLYFKNICSRPSCYACHFKTLHRLSDITIFDCWDAPSVSKMFSTKGATNVFIHTAKGKVIFDRLKDDFIWSASDITPVIKRDGIMIKHCVPANPRREDFFKDLNSLPIDKVEQKYLDCSLAKKAIAVLKPMLYKLGVFRLYIKFKNRV